MEMNSNKSNCYRGTCCLHFQPPSVLKMFEIPCNRIMIIHTTTKNSNYRRKVTFELKIFLVKTSVYLHTYSHFTGAKKLNVP